MKEDAKIAQVGPFEVSLEKGKTYYWCRCGRSEGQPYCDGSHQATSFKPVKFTAEKEGKAYLCGCKRTSNQPFCDGTHHTLE